MLWQEIKEVREKFIYKKICQKNILLMFIENAF